MSEDQRIADRLSALGVRDIRPDLAPCAWSKSESMPCDPGRLDVEYSVISDKWVIVCWDCAECSDGHEDIEAALSQWNARQKREAGI